MRGGKYQHVILPLAGSHVHFWGELIAGGINPSQPQCQHRSPISQGSQEPSCHSKDEGCPFWLVSPSPPQPDRSQWEAFMFLIHNFFLLSLGGEKLCSIWLTPTFYFPKRSRKHKMVLFYYKNKAPVYWSGSLWTLSWRHCFIGNVWWYHRVKCEETRLLNAAQWEAGGRAGEAVETAWAPPSIWSGAIHTPACLCLLFEMYPVHSNQWNK